MYNMTERKYIKLPRIDGVFESKQDAIDSISSFISQNIVEFNDGEELLVRFKDNDNTIRVGLNNYLIRNLNNFPYDNDCYTLDTSEIQDHSTTIYQIKLWLNKSSNTTKKVKYTFQVKKLN